MLLVFCHACGRNVQKLDLKKYIYIYIYTYSGGCEGSVAETITNVGAFEWRLQTCETRFLCRVTSMR